MSRNKNFVIMGIVTFALAAYMYTPQKETQAQEPLVIPDAPPSGNLKGREILALLEDLKVIQLDQSIFSDPMFQSLQDTSVALNSEPKGRTNPFAPLGKDIVSGSTENTATTSVRGIPFGSGIDTPSSKTSNEII